MNPIDIASHGPVIPVIVIDRVEDALPLAEALLAGGVKVLEVTLRTAAGLPAIEAIACHLPEAVVGVGTVLNADDALVAAMSQRAEQALTFGSAADASVRWSELSTDDVGCPRFNLSFQGRTAYVQLRLIGAHHCANAAAAATAALAAGLEFDRVIDSLQSVTSISKWRMELTEPVAGIRIINDAYNANPDSMRAALEALAQMGARSGHRTVAVLGEMRELGESSLAEHQGIGRLASDLGIDTVVVVGEQADGIAQMCKTPRRARGVEHAVELVREDIGSAPAIVLVKASRGAALERVVDQLTDQLRQEQA